MDNILSDIWSSIRSNRGALFGLGLVLCFSIIALTAPWLAPYEPSQVFEGSYRLPAFWIDGSDHRFLLGTDDVGRDILSRLLYGSQVSLAVGFLVVGLALTIGTTVGLLSGYFGGWLDFAIMRVIDVMMSLPSILLAIVVVAILGPGLENAILAISLMQLPSFIRLTRSTVLKEKEQDYVTASRTLGASHFRQAVINILPNCVGPLTVQATLGFSNGILEIAALSFLGLGAQPPTPEWGTMLADARPYIESSPAMVTLPGLCILAIVLAFNLLGDALRDGFDPRLRR